MSTKNTFRYRLQAAGIAAIAAVLIGASASVVHAQNRVVLEPGTVIPVILNTELSSNGSIAGDTFTARVDTSKDAYNRIMQAATVTGVVRAATPQAGDQPGTLEVAFTNLRLANGESYSISGTPTSLDPKNVTLNSNGILVAKSTRKDDRLKYAGIGAGAGALIKILGGDRVRIEDVLLGGLLGYGAGSVIKSPEEVHDVNLKPGTPMGVLVGRQVLYHRTMPASTSTWRRNRPTSSWRGNRGTFIQDGVKYYGYNGERWAMNLSTGERYRVSGRPVFHRANRKYYTFQGHPYYLDLITGERVRLN